ncbi:MAG: hypothetical protein AAGH15_04505 [Myxococcota bacterium]
MRSSILTMGVLLALGCGDDGRASPDAGMGGDDMGGMPRTDSGPRDLGTDTGGMDLGGMDLGGELDFGLDTGVTDLGGDGFGDMGTEDLGGDGFVEMGPEDLGGDGFMEMGPPDLGESDGFMEMGPVDLGGDGFMEMGPPDFGADGGPDLGPGSCSASVACPATDYCDFPDADPCGAAGMTGTCRTRPMICPLIFDPHCGCDGMTYGNQCEAFAGGTDTVSSGACP